MAAGTLEHLGRTFLLGLESQKGAPGGKDIEVETQKMTRGKPTMVDATTHLRLISQLAVMLLVMALS